MSQEILIQDLQQKSSDRISEIWREAEKKAENLRAEQERMYALLLVEESGRLEKVERSVAVPIVFAAEKQALQIVDEAMRKLSERLYEMAHSMLPQVRQEGYEDVFAGLVEELPPYAWETVTVNTLDMELVRSYFPDTEIQTDSSIAGGFVASGDSNRYQVINTLERRLEKVWPYVLPSLLEDIIGEKDAAPAA